MVYVRGSNVTWSLMIMDDRTAYEARSGEENGTGSSIMMVQDRLQRQATDKTTDRLQNRATDRPRCGRIDEEVKFHYLL